MQRKFPGCSQSEGFFHIQLRCLPLYTPHYSKPKWHPWASSSSCPKWKQFEILPPHIHDFTNKSPKPELVRIFPNNLVSSHCSIFIINLVARGTVYPCTLQTSLDTWGPNNGPAGCNLKVSFTMHLKYSNPAISDSFTVQSLPTVDSISNCALASILDDLFFI